MNIKHVFLIAFTSVFSLSYSNELVDFQNCVFKTENSDSSSKLIIQADLFTSHLSNFDLSSRLKTSKSVSLEEYKLFISKQVLDWNESEKQKLTTIQENLKKKLNGYSIQVPKEIIFIKTTGLEEGNAGYCRSNNIIVLPSSYTALQISELQDTILHELFHIYSRNNPSKQEKLYNAIGFYKTHEVELPQNISVLHITNPDAVGNNYFFTTAIGNTDYKVIPVLLASSMYDEKKGGEFFDYLKLVFLAIEETEDKTILLQEKGSYRYYDVSNIPNYFDKIGKNTGYIIHPEEILADNFVLLVNESQNIKTQKTLNSIKEIILR